MYPILTQKNQLKANKVRSINTIYTINLQAKKKKKLYASKTQKLLQNTQCTITI